MARLTDVPQIYGILGENISYSLSPLIYNELFRHHRIAACYARFDIRKRDLQSFVAAARMLPLSGFNITIPYKEAVAGLIDVADPIVQATGATNLVIVNDHRLLGYNTDLDGIRATVENRLHVDVAGKSVLLIGSGGAARTALYYLGLKRAAETTIVMRTSARARRFRAISKRLAPGAALSFVSASRITLDGFDLCINCTPIPTRKLLTSQASLGHCAVFDLSYLVDTPIKSRRYADGRYMLAAQAARNFELMTGIEVKVESVLKIINRGRRA